MAMETVVASSERQSRGQFDTRPGILALPSVQRSVAVSTGGDRTTFVSSCLGFALFFVSFSCLGDARFAFSVIIGSI